MGVPVLHRLGGEVSERRPVLLAHLRPFSRAWCKDRSVLRFSGQGDGATCPAAAPAGVGAVRAQVPGD